MALSNVNVNRSVWSAASVKTRHMKPLKMEIYILDHSSFWNNPTYEVDQTEECDLPQKTVHRCPEKILIVVKFMVHKLKYLEK